MVTSLLTDRRLRSCLSGAVLTTWSLTRSKQWRWSWTSGETPLLSPHSPSWITLWLKWIQIPGHHNFSGSEVGQSDWVHGFKKRPKRGYTSFFQLSKQLYSAIIESILCTSIAVWFSSATKSDLRRLQRVVRPAERIIGTTLPTLSSRVSKRAGKSLWTPHIQHTPLWTVTVWSTLQSSGHQNDQTQKQFLPSGNLSYEHLTLNVEHTTLLYNYLFTTNTYFFISNLHISDLTHNCPYCILCFCYFVQCLFVYLYIVLLLSVSCPVAVILLHWGASVTITNSLYV